MRIEREDVLLHENSAMSRGEHAGIGQLGRSRNAVGVAGENRQRQAGIGRQECLGDAGDARGGHRVQRDDLRIASQRGPSDQFRAIILGDLEIDQRVRAALVESQ